MAQTIHIKPRVLTRDETFVSFRNWCHTLSYVLSLNPNFAPFLKATWHKKTTQNALRGLTNDGENVAEANRKTAEQKEEQLSFMLEQIACFAPVISRNSIVKNSTSLQDIWRKLRQHYNFQPTGAQFLDVVNIKKGPDEYPEELYERLLAFYEDSLLTTTSGITHHGTAITAEEDLTPTLENTIMVMWLQLIHPGLPQLVKQRYGSELRNRTLASLKEEISSSLEPLLDQLKSMEEVQAFRCRAGDMDIRVKRTSCSTDFDMNGRPQQKEKPSRSCGICKFLNKSGYDTHYIDECWFLPRRDVERLNLSAAGRTYISVDSDECADESTDCEDDNTDCEDDNTDWEDDNTECTVRVWEGDNTQWKGLLDKPTVRRTSMSCFPMQHTFCQHKPLALDIDTGENTSCMPDDTISTSPTARRTSVHTLTSLCDTTLRCTYRASCSESPATC